MKIVEVITKNEEKYTLYDVTEINENKDWFSVRTRDGYKRSFKKENILKNRTYNED